MATENEDDGVCGNCGSCQEHDVCAKCEEFNCMCLCIDDEARAEFLKKNNLNPEFWENILRQTPIPGTGGADNEFSF